MGYVIIKTKVIPASREALVEFSRDDLRDYAKSIGVKRGRDKDETILNLLASGHATLCASLGD